MFRCACLLVIMACGAPGPAPKPTHEAARGKPVQNAMPAIPTPSFDVVPAELGDPGILDRIHARTVVRSWCVLTIAGELVTSGTSCSDNETNDVAAVIDVAAREVRVVIEKDNARYTAGVPSEMVRPTVLVPTTIGHLTLVPGVALEATKQRDEWRVTVVDDRLALDEQRLPHDRVGRVFVAQPGAAPPVLGVRTGSRWQMPRDKPRIVIAKASVIREQPSATATKLASTKDQTIAIVLGAANGWTEIEVHRQHVRLRGFIADTDVVSPYEDFGTITTGGSGYGMSHAMKYQLPAGTCLYDAVDGKVIGVTLEARERLGQAPLQGWAKVWVGTPWSKTLMAVKDVGSDPAQSQWETCTREPHR